MQHSNCIYIPDNSPVLKNWLINIVDFTLIKNSHFNNYNMTKQNQILQENINNTDISNAIILDNIRNTLSSLSITNGLIYGAAINNSGTLNLKNSIARNNRFTLSALKNKILSTIEKNKSFI